MEQLVAGNKNMGDRQQGKWVAKVARVARVGAGKPVAGTQVTISHQGSKASNLQIYKSTFRKH